MEKTRRWLCWLSSSPCIVPIMNRPGKTHTEHRWQQQWPQQQHKETPPPTTSTHVPSTMVIPSGTPSNRGPGTTTIGTHTTPRTIITHTTINHDASWLIVVCVIIVRGVVCVPIVVVPGPRLDGVPDGITIVDGTCVDVVGGGVSLCCCCGHCCCHRCSVCVLPGRFMIGTMQGDDDNQHNQRLVFSMRLRVTTRNSAVIMCSRVHTISRIDTYGDENYYSRFPCPMMWANVGA